ncbi:MAG: MBL fold metallo-hydrolase [Chloroflexota bacterium]|nr:MBL fold metallo-hydrolase [Caldilinea sp.]GIK71990.1 MAG: MBL fold metallo-hydrolase [Chloroflexota bacterium]
MTAQLTITRIKLPLANAYLVQGERPILVDVGAPGDADRIVRALAQNNVQPADLSLILLTHGHGDHVGAANELATASGAPIALHYADDAMARSGRNVLGTLTGLEARMIAPFVDKPFPSVTASILLDAPLDLRAYGVAGEVIATPGHTPGSISIFFANGDAIVGDLLMGGRMGGALWASQPGVHYFVGDFAQLAQSMEIVLARRPQRLLVGHGGPLAADAVQAWWGGNPISRR